MSYILDALRKADAERVTGAVPDLHAQQYGTMPADDEPPGRGGWLIALTGALGVALVGVLAWAWLGREAPADAVRSTVTTPSTPVTVAAPSTAPSTTLPMAQAALHAAPPTPAMPTPAVTASPSSIAPITAAAVPPRPRTTSATAESTRAQKVKPSIASEGPQPVEPTTNAPLAAPSRRAPNAAEPIKSAADASPNRVYQTSELPDAIHRELPAVSINGSSYSADAGSRVLIANGQVLHEGETVAAGVQLEKIGRRSAVLIFKGYRYELMY